MQKGFTLAEVLITLGVIGVVAAITMPILIQKHRAKILESNFKKSYSNISKILLYIQEETGLTDLKRNYAVYDSSQGKYLGADELVEIFANVIKYTKKMTPREINTVYIPKNYGGYTGQFTSDFTAPAYILQDGSSVNLNITSFTVFISVDTNGPYKGPNRFGFDIFDFTVSNKIDSIKASREYTEEELFNISSPHLAGNPCYKNSKQKSNGIGCSYYAINNINPDDNTKTYWDNLPR